MKRNLHFLLSGIQKLLAKKQAPKSLDQIDYIYKTIIYTFSKANRLEYCKSLIYRTQKDLLYTKSYIKKRKLKKLIKAAKSEVKRLQ